MADLDDKSTIAEWQKTKDPVLFSQLMTRFNPIVHSAVNRFKTVGVAPATLRAQATAQVIRAMNTYDPTKNTQPSTHIWNNMMKIQRTATESLMSGHVPEYRSMKRSTFTIVRDNLTDRLGYEPSVDEMADELKWSKKETARMNAELGGEVTASGADFDFYGNSSKFEHKDKALADYLYAELKGKEKTVFEHTFGVGGKSILSNKDIAAKLNTNEMAIHRMKKKMSQKISSYR
jgi:DNA-directed RNA polymerase specialized sigma subunit